MRKSVAIWCLAGLLAASAGAVTRTWQGGSGGQWSDTGNWLNGNPPVSGDVADLSAVTGTIILTADAVAGEILYNPVFSGTTNTLTLVSDTAAPSSRTVILSGLTTNHVQVATGAELLLDADLKPAGRVRKDGQGALILKRRVPPVIRTDLLIEQGRLINEGEMAMYACSMSLGTVEPDAGEAPEFVMRAGSSYYTTTAVQGSDLLWGRNWLGHTVSGSGSRAVIRHEGGVLDLTTNSTAGVLLNGCVTNSYSVFHLSGGEVNLRGKTVYAGFYGTGVINQTGGKLSANALYFSFNTSAAGKGTYNLTGGELWLGGSVLRGGGAAAFNLGGGCLYPFNSGFTVSVETNPKLTGTNGLTRFCSTGSEYTNAFGGLSGASGFVKEGADTLNFTGPINIAGPLIVSNGTVNMQAQMTVSNAILIAGGAFNLGTNAYGFSKFGSLMVTGGVFQLASNCVPVVTGSDPWVRVAGTGAIRLLSGAALLRLSVEESGGIDLSAGGKTSVYRLMINGVEVAPGLYTSANCAAITGSGTLAVLLKRPGTVVSDHFGRADGFPANDSLGESVTGGADWAELAPAEVITDGASIVNNELRLGIGNMIPKMVLAAASWPNVKASTRMRFKLVGASGATTKNACGFFLRRNISVRSGLPANDATNGVEVLMTPAGGLYLRESFSSTTARYYKNPFTGGNYYTYGAPGTLPTSINGAPFDANGDGRLGDDEPFELSAHVSGGRVQVLINGAPICANNMFGEAHALSDNSAGLFKQQMSSANAEVHDSYHDSFTVTNLPYLISHRDDYDPYVAAASPVENWSLVGAGTGVTTGRVTETVGGETVKAWQVNDASSAANSLFYYETKLLAMESAEVSTNRWRFTMRLRVVNANDPVDWGVAGQVSATESFTLNFGSDAAGNAMVAVNGGSAAVVGGGSVYHTYVLEYNPNKGQATLSCDGVVLKTGVTGVSGALNRIVFGAGSTLDQGAANYQLVQFELLPPPVPPPPGTLIRLL